MTEQEVQVGERLAVSYDITNRGQSDGEQTVELTLDGEVADSEALVLDTGEKDRMSLVTDAFTDEDDGQLYEVEIVTDDRVAQVMTVEVTAIPDSGLLHFRYDFSELESGTTSNVPDLSGNGFDLDDGSFSGVGTDINGVQAGEFDGVDESVYRSTSFSSVGPATVFIAFNPTDPLGLNHVLQFNDGEDLALRYFDDQGGWVFGNMSEDQVIIGTSNDFEDEPVIMSGIFSDDSNDGLFRINGTEQGTGRTADGGELTHVGLASREPRTGDRFTPADIGEVLLYEDVRTTSEIEEVEEYLSDKWGIGLD